MDAINTTYGVAIKKIEFGQYEVRLYLDDGTEIVIAAKDQESMEIDFSIKN
jgi:hypothetical protein